MAQKRATRRSCRPRRREPGARTPGSDPWEAIEAAQQRRSSCCPTTFLEGGAGFNSQLLPLRAHAGARPPTSAPSPNERATARVHGRRAAAASSSSWLAAAPVYPELEQLTMSFGLERMREWLGPDHPLVRALLAKDSPDALAATPGRRHRSSATRPCASALGRRPGGDRRPASDPMIRSRAAWTRGARACASVRGRGRGADAARDQEKIAAAAVRRARHRASTRTPRSRCA